MGANTLTPTYRRHAGHHVRTPTRRLYVPVFLPTVDMSPYPNVVKYMERMKARPACAETVAARVDEATAAPPSAPTAAAAAAATK
jgi:glutathione S-transferase